MASSRASFHWDDPLLLSMQLTDEERMVMDSARAYCQDKLAPRVLEAFRHERMDTSIFREMGELGLLGPTIPETYGGASATPMPCTAASVSVENSSRRGPAIACGTTRPRLS